MNAEVERLKNLGWVIPPVSSDGVIYFAKTHAETISYPEEVLEALGLEAGASFWFDHRAEAVRRMIRTLGVRSVWEVGSGTGAMAMRLLPYLEGLVTVEPMARGAQLAAEIGLTSICGTLQDLQLPDSSIDCIGLFDVVEHLEHPADLLQEVGRVLRPGGFVIVTVPAFQWLWGDVDDVAGHYRRFTKKSIDDLFRQVHFTPIQSEYLFAALTLPAVVFRSLPYRLGHRKKRQQVLSDVAKQLHVPRSINRIAKAILRVETYASSAVSLPLGSSVLAAYQFEPGT